MTLEPGQQIITMAEARRLLGPHFIGIGASLSLPSEEMVPTAIRDAFLNVPYTKRQLAVAVLRNMVLFPLVYGLQGSGTFIGDDVPAGWYFVSRRPFRDTDNKSYKVQCSLLPEGTVVPSALLLQQIGLVWHKLYSRPFSNSGLRCRSSGGAVVVTFAKDGCPGVQRMPPERAYNGIGLAHQLVAPVG